jgi:hypothetical protein
MDVFFTQNLEENTQIGPIYLFPQQCFPARHPNSYIRRLKVSKWQI